MVKQHSRGRKRGRSKQQQDNEDSLQEERPSKVAKRNATKTKPKGATTGTSPRDGSLDGEDDLRPPAATSKAGVANNTTSTNSTNASHATTTPRGTKQQAMNVPGTTAKRPPTMVSPELTFVPVPPSVLRMLHPTTSDEYHQMHSQENHTVSQVKHSNLDTTGDREKEAPAVLVRDATNSRDGDEPAMQNQDNGLVSHMFIPLMEKITALVLLTWGVIIGVLYGHTTTQTDPAQSTESQPSQTYTDSSNTATTLWTRVSEFVQKFETVEHGIASDCWIRMTETCRECATAAKSNIKFVVATMQHALNTTRVFSTNTVHLSSTSSKRNRDITRLAPVCIVALLYMMFQQPGHFSSSMADATKNSTATMWSTSVCLDHSIASPAAASVTTSSHSPIGLAYVTQQLKALDQQDARMEKKKKKRKQASDKKAGAARQEEEETIVEPALEPTIEFRSGGSSNWFDHKANPSPIGLAFVTQQLLEMDD